MTVAVAAHAASRARAVHRTRFALPLLALLLAGATLLALGVGALPVSAPKIVAVLLGAAGVDTGVSITPQEASVILAVRLPRVALGILVGGSLGVAGAVMQGSLRNPIVDPGLLGVSSGCALGAATAIVIEGRLLTAVPTWLAPYTVSAAAFATGLAACVLVQRLARSEGRTSIAALLLIGVAVTAITEAVTGLISFMATDAQLRAITAWRLGSLAGATWHKVSASAPLVALPILATLRLARPLNALLLGEDEATHLGFDVERSKRAAVVLVALLVGTSVAGAGVLGFVGLAVPHLGRLLVGPDHRPLLPASALLGATLLLLADTVARTIVAPAELPLGVLTAIVGAPFLVVLLARDQRRLA